MSEMFTHKPPFWVWITLVIGVLWLMIHFILHHKDKVRLRDLGQRDRIIVINHPKGGRPLVQYIDDFQKDAKAGKEPVTDLFYLSKKDIPGPLKVGAIYEVSTFAGKNILTMTDSSVSVPAAKKMAVA